MIGQQQLWSSVTRLAAFALGGVSGDEHKRLAGVDPGALRAVATESAEEEFTTLPIPGGGPGRLERLALSGEGREAVEAALIDAFEMGVMVGMDVKEVVR